MDTRAAVLDRFGDPDVLRVAAVPLPPPGPGDVRLRVLATALNPVDLHTRAGMIIGATYPDLAPRFPMVLGWDAAGVVEEVGDQVRGWRPGDRAIAMVHQVATQAGTHAEQVVLPADLLAPWPGDAEPTIAAALPLAGLTARQAVAALGLRPGDRLLVNGPLGAIGSLAVQLARRAGARVAGAVRPGGADLARTLGVEWLVDRDGDIAAQAVAAAGGPLDAALDVVGGTAADAALAAVRNGGRSVTVVPRLAAGLPPPVRGIIRQAVYIVPDSRRLAELSALLGNGTLTIQVGEVLPLDKAAEAHRLLASRSVAGRVVLAG
jgi:NADPH:quinone reductase-like Zn-dependent oxidoreductase